MVAPQAPDDATLDPLLRGRIAVYQPRRGPRVSLDSLLLSDFAGGRGRRRIVDLGCGVGIVGLVLLAADPRATCAAVELQPALAELARHNAVLNGCGERMTVIAADLRGPLPLAPETFDLAVANPPFHAPSRPAEAADRALARQELACTLSDVTAAARRLLRPRGELAIVYPAARVGELMACLLAADMPARVLRFVHSVSVDAAVRVLALGSRGYRGGVEVPPPLVVHNPDRTYTEEAAKILGDRAG